MRRYYQKYEQQITKIKKLEIRDIKNVGKKISLWYERTKHLKFLPVQRCRAEALDISKYSKIYLNEIYVLQIVP